MTMGQKMQGAGPSGAVYGLGFIGAVVYFISHATGFWMGVLGFLKAIIWPAMLVYGALQKIGM
jgi:amino acid permease